MSRILQPPIFEKDDSIQSSGSPLKHTCRSRSSSARVAAAPYPNPAKIRAYMSLPKQVLINRLVQRDNEIREQEALIDRMVVHYNQIAAEVTRLRNRMHKPKKHKGTQLITTATCLTGEAGWALAEAQREAAEEATRVAAEKRAREEAVARDQLDARTPNSTEQIFTRAVSKSRRKSELEDIIHALGIECEKRDPILANQLRHFTGTIPEHVDKIIEHLKSHPSLRVHPQFTGLYASTQSLKAFGFVADSQCLECSPHLINYCAASSGTHQ